MAGLWEPVSGIFWSTAPSTLGLGWMENLGNSSFFTTVFGALAGAFAGAWAAQRIAKNSKRRDELNAEIRVVNAGITLGLSILNSAMSVKNQFIKPVKEQYEAERKKFLEYRTAHPQGGEIHITFNLLHLPHMTIPADHLQQLVLQQGSTFALRAVVALVDANLLLGEAIKLRNHWVEKFEKKEFPPGFTYPEIYFGLTVKGGRHDQFGSTTKAIYSYNDDIIFYSLRLCTYLNSHGENLKKELKRISNERIGIIRVDPEIVAKSGLLPPMEDYEGWEQGYSEVQTSSVVSWWRWRRR